MTTIQPGRRRVVITGMGAITALGQSVQAFWDSLVAGRSGLAAITQFDASQLPCRVAGEVVGFNPTDWMERADARRVSRASQFGVAAARQAIQDAGLTAESVDPNRTGVCVGTGFVGIEKVDEGLNVMAGRGHTRIGPFLLIAALANMPAHHAGLLLGARGPTVTVVTACAAGTQGIGEGAEYIRRGLADVMISGGVEAAIHPLAIAGFAAMRALSTHHNDEPALTMSPYDKDREGFVVGEGAGIMILEELEHARARGAHVYCEVLGSAASADAHHVAAPDPDAEGAILAMQWALQSAGITPDAIDYINPHGSSTPVGDVTETLAMKTVFGERAHHIPISSTKSMIGHSLGAAGALEAIACVKTIETGWIHPTINYVTPDPECDLDYVPNTARQADVRVALSNSFGLGGQNASLILGKLDG